MVVFTCNNCGESLQKPKVEKHFAFSCRGSKNLTCVDCFKDFRGEEYAAHTKCVTENQRYGDKNYVEKAKKGEVKQESWMEMIKSILAHEPNITASCRNLLNNICNFNNVPRKKQKFINFIKSSTGGRTSIGDIENVWDLIEKHKNKNSTGNNDEATNENCSGEKRKLIDVNVKDANDEELDSLANENKSTDDGEQPKKKKKNKHKRNEAEKEEIENGNADNMVECGKANGEKKSKNKKKLKDNEKLNGNGETNGNIISNEEELDKSRTEDFNAVHSEESFCLAMEIENLVTKKGSMSVGKLEKKVLKKYKNVYGDNIDLGKFAKKFNKKLKKTKAILVDNGTVKLKVEQ